MREATRIFERSVAETGAFLDLLQRFVALESPSHESKAASDLCGRFYGELLSSLGCAVRTVSRANCGDQVAAEYGEGDGGILLLGHYDTVFPLGTLKEMPWKVEDGKAYGPGVLDMKGGLLQAWFALKVLRDLGLAPARKIGFFINSDEESGSRSSREDIRAAALKSDIVLVPEPGLKELGDVKTSRSGRAVYRITAHGRSAHSGNAPQDGVSAATELALQIPELGTLNDFPNGTTVSVTWMQAGVEDTAMIPGKGSMVLDVRAVAEEAMERVTGAIEGLRPRLEGIRLEIEGGVEKPPYEFNARNRALFERAEALAAELNMSLKPNHVGGGSDANFTSPAGIPTLDGLGMTGAHLHSPGEYITIEHIPHRIALLALLLRRL